MVEIIIALDTNFLLYCSKQKIDFLSEIERLCSFAYQVIVPQQVVSELKNIAETAKGKEKSTAEIALQLLLKFASEGKIMVKEINAGNADDALVRLDKRNYVIATLDRELRKKLKNAKLLGIKQFKYLYFT